MYFFIRFAQNFSSDLLKTSSTSANGRRRRRQQAHRDQEGEQSQLSGAKVYWCQAFQVSKVSGAKFFWFQRYLVPKVSGVKIQMLTNTFAKEVQMMQLTRAPWSRDPLPVFQPFALLGINGGKRVTSDVKLSNEAA